MTQLNKGICLKNGAYCIERATGSGSFGITYLASMRAEVSKSLGSIQTSIPVAVKEFFMTELNSRGADGSSVEGSRGMLVSDYRRKFVREARNLSKLDHPGIVKVLEVWDENNTSYYAMEYLDGGSLDDRIERQGGIGEAEALRLTAQIGDALAYMHAHKMLHLDLKPKNIMLRRDGSSVLIDFGLSKQYDAEGNPESSTKVGGGTPGYAPIEQADYREGIGFPVTMDVYALGATLYKMLTGERPPEAGYIFNEGFPVAVLQTRGVSDWTIGVVVKAMSPRRNDRYQTVSEMLAALPRQGQQPPEEDDSVEAQLIDEDTPLEDIVQGNGFGQSGFSGRNNDSKQASRPSAPRTTQPPQAPTQPSAETQGNNGSKEKRTTAIIAAVVALLAILAVAVFLSSGTDPAAEQEQQVSTEVVTAAERNAKTTATLSVASNPAGATVTIDGRQYGTTPCEIGGLAAGKYSITLKKSDYQDESRQVTMKAGQTYTLDFALKEQMRETSATPKSTEITAVSNKSEPSDYVDLGLPSGTLWKDRNEPGGFYIYNKAISKFGSRLPTEDQCEELIDKCTWTWTGNGMKVTGPNGNSIVLPAEGYRNCDGNVCDVGTDYGGYWSATTDGSYNGAIGLYFISEGSYTHSNDRCYGHSVRLVRNQ